MAVSKRLRYEILRRDNFTCRYCGAQAPQVLLEVDHVMPRSRGGSDTQGNLVTSCEDCNGGKAATLPEDWLREEVKQAALEWKRNPGLEPTEDDLTDMYAYQDALYALEGMPVREVLHWIARTYVTAMPYRPDLHELIVCAARMAQNAERGADAR